MLLTGHQPNYLPYLGFFHKIALADLYLVVDTTQFVKRGPFGWIHRNKIRVPHGQGGDGWAWLSLPVKTSGKFEQPIIECELDERVPWRRKHWRSIEQQYAKAPHWQLYAPRFAAIYEREWTHLSPLAEALIREVLDCLEIRTPVRRLSELGVTGKAGDLIVEFCRALGADRYLSGVHGKDYLDPEVFRRAGIELVFQEFHHPVYPQIHGGEFVPNLSALDLLFNCGPESRKILLSQPT